MQKHVKSVERGRTPPQPPNRADRSEITKIHGLASDLHAPRPSFLPPPPPPRTNKHLAYNFLSLHMKATHHPPASPPCNRNQSSRGPLSAGWAVAPPRGVFVNNLCTVHITLSKTNITINPFCVAFFASSVALEESF